MIWIFICYFHHFRLQGRFHFCHQLVLRAFHPFLSNGLCVCISQSILLLSRCLVFIAIYLNLIGWSASLFYASLQTAYCLFRWNDRLFVISADVVTNNQSQRTKNKTWRWFIYLFIHCMFLFVALHVNCCCHPKQITLSFASMNYGPPNSALFTILFMSLEETLNPRG